MSQRERLTGSGQAVHYGLHYLEGGSAETSGESHPGSAKGGATAAIMVRFAAFVMMMDMMMTQPGSARVCESSGRLGHPAGA